MNRDGTDPTHPESSPTALSRRELPAAAAAGATVSCGAGESPLEELAAPTPGGSRA